MGYSRTKSKGARARLGGAPGCANLCHPLAYGVLIFPSTVTCAFPNYNHGQFLGTVMQYS